ncbi:hypothetical protein E2C01_047141 [Portunus trituberculatus]|uniref:Uncharacterized protein n=1 Tax=Portunus trituberculatus TaxID=210409 RepID=A0A5B7G2U3_PORTR|nr:hypothetical protein [Portunus trituberculatus]
MYSNDTPNSQYTPHALSPTPSTAPYHVACPLLCPHVVSVRLRSRRWWREGEGMVVVGGCMVGYRIRKVAKNGGERLPLLKAGHARRCDA